MRQNYPGKVEIIVSDGGSSDNTVNILKNYSNDIIWWSEKDKGFADAVNKGLRISTGDIIGIQSSDDCYSPNAFNMVAELYQSRKPLLIAGERIKVDENLKILDYCNLDGELTLERFLKSEIPVFQDAAFFSREAFLKAGFLDTDSDYVADYAYWIKILSFGNGAIIKNALSYYTMHIGQRTQTCYFKFADDIEKFCTRYLNSDIYLNNGRLLVEKPVVLAGAYQIKAYWYIRGNKKEEGAQILKYALEIYPECKKWAIFEGLLFKCRGLKGLIKIYGFLYVLKKLVKKIHKTVIRGRLDKRLLATHNPEEFLQGRKTYEY